LILVRLTRRTLLKSILSSSSSSPFLLVFSLLSFFSSFLCFSFLFLFHLFFSPFSFLPSPSFLLSHFVISLYSPHLSHFLRSLSHVKRNHPSRKLHQAASRADISRKQHPLAARGPPPTPKGGKEACHPAKLERKWPDPL